MRTYVFFLALVAASPLAAQIEIPQCTPVVPEERLAALAGEFCGEAWDEMAQFDVSKNATGAREDQEIERLGVLLNEIENPNGKLSAAQLQELADILKSRPSLRSSLRKNILASMFDPLWLELWCKWRVDKDQTLYRIEDLQEIRRIENSLACGLVD
ncbi:MAG: hypothetical protein AAF393_06890 [Pseudomonadota bacterium]